MTFADALARERVRAGLTQQQLGRQLGVSESTYRAYEAGRREIPADVAGKAIHLLGSPSLMAQRCFQCGVNALTPPWLDRVDTHPVVVRDKLLEELQEAAEALQALDLLNRRQAEDLSAEDRRRLDAAAAALADLYPALLTFFGTMQTTFALRPRAVAQALHRKLWAKGYVSPTCSVALDRTA